MLVENHYWEPFNRINRVDGCYFFKYRKSDDMQFLIALQQNGSRCGYTPVWSLRWSADETATAWCCGTAVRWWRPTPRRDNRGHWGCGWCWSGPGSGWSRVSQFPPAGPPAPCWHSPKPPWFLSWLNERHHRQYSHNDTPPQILEI